MKQNINGSQFECVAVSADEVREGLQEGAGNAFPAVISRALEGSLEAVGNVHGQAADVVERTDDVVGIGVEDHDLPEFV